MKPRSSALRLMPIGHLRSAIVVLQKPASAGSTTLNGLWMTNQPQSKRGKYANEQSDPMDEVCP
jgi:hypothetical protein